jgi:hypothetical protein
MRLIIFTSLQTHKLYDSSAWLNNREIRHYQQPENRYARKEYEELSASFYAAAETIE